MVSEYSQQMNVAVSPELRARIDAAAKRVGLRPAEWVRAQLVSCLEAADAQAAKRAREAAAAERRR